MAGQFYDEAMARQQEKLAATPDMLAQRRAMLQLLDLKEGERVLDVGSGNGILTREMLEIVGRSGQVCRVDSAEAMVEMARSLCPKCRFLAGDATDLPVGDQSFDAVTSEDWETWIADQRATADAGEYLFSLNRYVFSAVKK